MNVLARARDVVIPAPRARRTSPRRRAGLLVLLGVMVGVLVLLRWALTTPFAAGRVAAALEDVYQGPVRVGGVDIALLGSSSLSGLELFEENAAPGEEPWCRVREIRADVSAAGLLVGAAPRRLSGTAPEVTIRFDHAGFLLTRFPPRNDKAPPLPPSTIRQGIFTLQQQGYPDLVVRGASGELREETPLLKMAGKTDDPQWGRWDWSVDIDVFTGALWLRLATADIHLTRAMLESLPFVPDGVWKEVEVDGDSPVEITVQVPPRPPGTDPKAPPTAATKTRYRIALEPRNAHVRVPSVDLDADAAHGKVVIEDDVVHLIDLRGRCADGKLHVNGDLDFRKTPSKLHFVIAAERLDLRRLPKSWKLPPQVEGRFAGDMDCVVLLHPKEPAKLVGNGKGAVTEARVLGVSTGSVGFLIDADGDRFHFQPQLRLFR